MRHRDWRYAADTDTGYTCDSYYAVWVNSKQMSSNTETSQADSVELEERTVRGACPHEALPGYLRAGDNCAQRLRVIKVAGAEEHPTTDGFLCNKVNRYLERTYSDQRILYPMKRVGAKGEGKFLRISWDEALDTSLHLGLAKSLMSFGLPQAILPYSYMGTMGLVQGGSMDRRFFHRLGASLLDRTICATAGATGYLRFTIGGFHRYRYGEI